MRHFEAIKISHNLIMEYNPIMAKNTQKVETPETSLVIPERITPAAIVGMNTKLEIPQEMLPQEFQGQSLETLETGFAPTVKWVNPGNFVAGVFLGYEQKVGPNNANLYSFDAKGKQFGVWGSTVLDRTLLTAIKTGQLKPGYMVCITFVATIPSDHEGNDTKLFNIQVVKKG